MPFLKVSLDGIVGDGQEGVGIVEADALLGQRGRQQSEDS